MAMAEVVDHQSRNQVFGHLLGGCTRLAGGGSLGLSFRYAVCPGNFSSEGSRVPRSQKIITSTGGASMNHWSSDTGTAKDGEEAEQEPGELQSVPLRKSRHIN